MKNSNLIRKSVTLIAMLSLSLIASNSFEEIRTDAHTHLVMEYMAIGRVWSEVVCINEKSLYRKDSHIKTPPQLEQIVAKFINNESIKINK